MIAFAVYDPMKGQREFSFAAVQSLLLPEIGKLFACQCEKMAALFCAVAELGKKITDRVTVAPVPGAAP